MNPHLRHVACCALLGGPLGAAAVTLLVVVHQASKDRAAKSALSVSTPDPYPSRRGSGVDQVSPAVEARPAAGDLPLEVLELLTLDERLDRYLELRGHTISTNAITDAYAIAAQAEYVLGEASELNEAACALADGHGPGRLLAVWSEIADVVLSTTQLARTMRRVGVSCPPVEQLIEEKTQADRGRG